jgi:hypothetical protein
LRSHISRGELRLYSLRKFFRKYAAQAGPDFVNFWMGHTSSLGVDLHYFSRDVEHHRKQYAEKAMPFLRLETATPSETEQQIEELRGENAVLKGQVDKLQRTAPSTDDLQKVQDEINGLKRSMFRMAHNLPSTSSDAEIDKAMEVEQADLEILREKGYAVKIEKNGSFSKSRPLGTK